MSHSTPKEAHPNQLSPNQGRYRFHGHSFRGLLAGKYYTVKTLSDISEMSEEKIRERLRDSNFNVEAGQLHDGRSAARWHKAIIPPTRAQIYLSKPLLPSRC